jgi:hypothetical protein
LTGVLIKGMFGTFRKLELKGSRHINMKELKDTFMARLSARSTAYRDVNTACISGVVIEGDIGKENTFDDLFMYAHRGND